MVRNTPAEYDMARSTEEDIMSTTIGTDTQLRTTVTNELAWTPDVDGTHIGVAVVGGTVTLSGEVASYPEKRNAERAAQRIHGVVAIADEITVHNAWSALNDTDIAREAGEALERAVDVPPGIKAAVHDHVVTLTGDVEWHYQRDAAARSVHYLRGVRDVLNAITVKPQVSAGDIKASIGAALVRNAVTDSSSVKVAATSGGAVSLEGTVQSFHEKNQAGRIAWSAPGVTRVNNHLRLR